MVNLHGSKDHDRGTVSVPDMWLRECHVLALHSEQIHGRYAKGQAPAACSTCPLFMPRLDKQMLCLSVQCNAKRLSSVMCTRNALNAAALAEQRFVLIL